MYIPNVAGLLTSALALTGLSKREWSALSIFSVGDREEGGGGGRGLVGSGGGRAELSELS